MMFAVLAAAALVPAAPTISPREIDRAIAMGRYEQARIMIATAVGAGASGAAIERPLAALAAADGRHQEALARINALLVTLPDDALLLEQATLEAMRCGKNSDAIAFAARATARPDATWRAWNAKGVLADEAQDWAEADRAYGEAARLAPERPEVLNNLGWSRLLRGDWPGAGEALGRAAALDPSSARIANNLDLAQLGLAGDLPAP